MSYFARAETVPGMGPAWQRVWGNKARWDLNKTNKSGCCFTPAWLQLDFRLTSRSEKEFLYPEHQPLLPALSLFQKYPRNQLLQM